MKIKHILTLFCVTLTLAFLLVSCADTSGGGGGGDTTEKQFSNVSAESCGDSTLELNCFISTWNTANVPTDKAITGFSGTMSVKLPLVSEGTYDFYVDWGDGEDVEKIEAFNAPEVTHTYKVGGEKTIHIAGTIKGWRFFVEHPNFGDAVKLTDVTQWGSLSLGNTAGLQFYGAENFNPTATDAPNLSETTSLYAAFSRASNFNADISDWDVSKITDMSYMFNFASSFNNNGKPLDWGAKTSKVTNMNNMFLGAGVFNQDISAWDVGEVTSMKGMFFGAKAFNQDISDWNVSQVTDMRSMFNGASSFNNNGKPLDWGNKTSKVIDMQWMFLNASVFNQNISGWKVEKVADYDLFAMGSGLEFNNIPFKFRGLEKVSQEVCGAKPELNCFISVWNTANTGDGASDTKTIVLPLVSEGTYNFYVNWGDGSVQQIKEFNAAEITHTYSTEDAEGEKTIHIAGTIKGWRFFLDFTDQGDAAKLADVTQWGSLSLGNTDGRQFYGAENFNPTATDAPDLSETTSLSYAFASASKFNADISDWDVSKVTKMNNMFNFATSFNNNGKPLDWGDKTSKVTDMQEMFSGASDFNQDISGWKVEKVADYDDFAKGSGLEFNNIPFKFRGLEKVSQEVCNAKPELNCFISTWNTENSGTGSSATNTIVLPLVSDGTYDFYVDWGDGEAGEKITGYDDTKAAHTHTYDTKGEKTIHITGTIKGWRFYVEFRKHGDAAKLLNVTQWGSLSLGNTAGLQFYGAENFNPTATDAPDLSETTNLSYAFDRASVFNQNISEWDVSEVTNMHSMFNTASSFNNNGKPLDWGNKTSKVTSMNYMFSGASVFNQDISAWDVGEVTSMIGMFWNAEAFNNNGMVLDWGIKTSKVEAMENMFNGASAFNQDISGWNVCNVTVANRANFDDGASATWKAEEKPKWDNPACPTN